MCEVGKKLRLNRILDPKTGRTVIIALDHGVEHGPSDFPEKVLDPKVIVKATADGGANGIMLHKGVARYTAEEVLTMVKEVMEAGAAGVTIGRNVWAYGDPVGMIKAIHDIVFENANVKEALKRLQLSARRK